MLRASKWTMCRTHKIVQLRNERKTENEKRGEKKKWTGINVPLKDGSLGTKNGIKESERYSDRNIWAILGRTSST